MRKKQIIIIIISLLCTCSPSLWAEIPSGYYSGVSQKTTPSAVLEALHSIIDEHTVIGYKQLDSTYYKKTDLDENGKIWDMYSNCGFAPTQAGGNQNKVCDCWNKEHSVPQSWFGEESPMVSDLFHLVPTDARVNNLRSNYPYGEVDGANGTGITKDNNKKALGKLGANTFPGYDGKVFEPVDEYKGDFARIYFYMATRYLTTKLNSSEGNIVFTYTSQTTGLTTYAVNLFLKWHRQDPVSVKEIKRNEAVYGIQHNRNPFVDYPYMAEFIWGTEKNNRVDFSRQISSSDPRFVPGESNGYWDDTITDIDETAIPSSAKAEKILLNGQLFILRDGVRYDLTGQAVD